MLLFEQFNQFHALRFDEFFSLVENKIVKIKRKKWSKLSFFISKLLRMPLPGSWKTGNGSANHSYSYDHNCTCGWQNPFPVFQLPGKDTFSTILEPYYTGDLTKPIHSNYPGLPSIDSFWLSFIIIMKKYEALDCVRRPIFGKIWQKKWSAFG